MSRPTTTIIKDINGKDLVEGDTVLVYVQRYAKEQDQDGIWTVDQSKPLPLADIPMAQGTIGWDDYLLAWTVRYSWVCNNWKGKSAAPIGGGEYAYEKIDNTTSDGYEL